MLLVHAVAAAKAGDNDEARSYLERVLYASPDNEQKQEAWLWLSELAADPEKKRGYLEDILAYNPTHAIARRKLALLDGRLQEADIINPDTHSAPSPKGAASSQVQQFSCPNCSARMVYAPDGTRLHCEHCGYDQGLATRDKEDAVQTKGEQDFFVAMATAEGHVGPQAIQTFDCQRCGHAFVVGPSALSVTCPYCDSVYVVEELTFASRQLIPPQAILPFAISFDKAQARLNAWFQEKKFKAHAEPHGLYVPAYTFDIGGSLEWRGFKSTNDQRVPTSGFETVHYDDMVVPAYKKLPAFAPEMRHYDLSALVPYDPRYLADWPAEVYDITMSDASLVARREVLKEIKPRIEATTGSIFEPVTITGWSTAGMMPDSFKLILLPLWMAHYRVEGKSYDVLINGQNGRLRGQRPPRKGILGGLRDLFD
jgi:tetratricopeptide (TPR) repeat protein